MPQLGVLITNSRPPMQHEIAKWGKHGFVVYYQPLLKIVNLPVEQLTKTPQAIVLSSANGAASLQDSDWDRNIPVYGVGTATVTAAKSSGFKDCSSPNSKPYPSAINLVSWIKQNLQPSNGLIIHGSGEILRYNIAEMLEKYGFETIRVMLYKTQAVNTFEPEIEQSLKDGTIQKVELSSEQSLEIFVNLCKKSGVNFQQIEALTPSNYLRNAALRYGLTSHN
ncbi:MAG: uroporphyrinogen-III synthase [Proteobacteria bacterium]|nr:uroporphyrinogen-III synthase [Pseudomonadota bacterium]